MSEKVRVFITGYGAVSTIGPAEEGKDFFDALLAGADASGCGRRSLTERRIEELDPDRFIPDDVSRRMDRFSQLAYLAVKWAMRRARFEVQPEDGDRTGLVLNTCFGPLASTVGYLEKVIRDGPKTAKAALFPNTVYNAFSGRITIDCGILGSNTTVSGYNPICYGLDMIRDGLDDVVLVGGCDELVETITEGFRLGGYLPPVPTDQDDEDGVPCTGTNRSSVPLGEGAAALVLESEEHARSRGATLLAEVGDYGLTSSFGGFREVFPADSDGIERAMLQALDLSGLPASRVDVVSSSANGAARLDSAEREAIARVFGDGSRPRVCDVKSAVGETLGAAAAFSTILAVGALDRGRLPAHWGLPPGLLSERYVAGLAVHEAVDVALVNNVELGGSITSLVLLQAGDETRGGVAWI